MKTTLHCLGACAALFASIAPAQVPRSGPTAGDQLKRTQFLNHLLITFRSDMDDKPGEVPVWEHWLRTSGELPPDFDAMPANAFLPDMLQFVDGRPVTRAAQWPARREEMRTLLKKYMFGNWPAVPPKMLAVPAGGSRRGGPPAPITPANAPYTVVNVQLLFGPSVKAVEYMKKHPGLDRDTFRVAPLAVQLYVPKGSGPNGTKLRRSFVVKRQ